MSLPPAGDRVHLVKVLPHFVSILVVGFAAPLLAEDGFKSIFDGKTLAGWKCRPESQAGNWKVGDGKIVGSFGSTVTPDNVDLVKKIESLL